MHESRVARPLFSYDSDGFFPVRNTNKRSGNATLHNTYVAIHQFSWSPYSPPSASLLCCRVINSTLNDLKAIIIIYNVHQLRVKKQSLMMNLLMINPQNSQLVVMTDTYWLRNSPQRGLSPRFRLKQGWVIIFFTVVFCVGKWIKHLIRSQWHASTAIHSS